MTERRKRWWPVLKWLLTAVVLFFVGWQIAGDLRCLNLHHLRLRPAWLALSALLYAAALFCQGFYWFSLLRVFGQRPRLSHALRIHFIGHLGKYVPGKALTFVIRGTMIRSPDVKVGVAVIAGFYEVLTMMAAGALVSAALFTLAPPRITGLSFSPVWLGLLLLGLVVVPLMPGVFNRLVQRLANRFQKVEAFQLPAIRITTLLKGLAIGALSWTLIGFSAWVLLQSMFVDPPGFTGRQLAGAIAIVSLSYVAGFLAVFVPSGIGVREYLLLKLLPTLLPQPATAVQSIVAAAVVLLRLVWTLSEVVVAALCYVSIRRN